MTAWQDFPKNNFQIRDKRGASAFRDTTMKIKNIFPPKILQG